MPSRTVAVVQARLGSRRLPLKSLLCLHGRPIIDWVTYRIGRCRNLNRIIVAIPDTELDKVLRDHLEEAGVECFTGSETDVLTRILHAAGKAGATEVVRVCADNPLVWWEAVDRLVDFYKNVLPDYAYNHIPRNNLWPDGLGAEIASMKILEEIASAANRPEQREHCFNFILDNPSRYNIATFDPVEKELQRPEIRLDVDTVGDFRNLARMRLTPDMDARTIIAIHDRHAEY